VTECDVRSDEGLERVFGEVGGGVRRAGSTCSCTRWRFAAAEDLEGRFTDTPRDRFWMALDVSRTRSSPARASRSR
jgi:enoyl-[acyl-carrier-protein] reductase (NADH)